METNREIIYRKIPSLECRYEIDADGRHIRNIKSKKQYLIKKDNRGYMIVNLKNNEGKWRNFQVHRLVAECWVPKVPGKNFVDHIDRCKTNNHYKNLRWCTIAENNQNVSDEWKARHREIGKHLNPGHHNTVGVAVEWNGFTFPNFTQAAKYMSKQLNRSYSTTYKYLQQRRKYILGHQVRYIIAETAY